MPYAETRGITPSLRWIIGISGASGIIFAIDLVRALARFPFELTLVLSSNAIEILKLEAYFLPAPSESYSLENTRETTFGNAHPDSAQSKWDPFSDKKAIIDHILYGPVPYLSPVEKVPDIRKPYQAAINLYFEGEFLSPIASGSYQSQGMVVIPCSMATLARINLGLADNLLCRAAEVTLKEARKLILVPRETPLSLSALQNMLNLKLAGAQIVTPSPGFYHQPKEIKDLISFLTGKLLNLMGIPQTILPEWGQNGTEIA